MFLLCLYTWDGCGEHCNAQLRYTAGVHPLNEGIGGILTSLLVKGKMLNGHHFPINGNNTIIVWSLNVFIFRKMHDIHLIPSHRILLHLTFSMLPAAAVWSCDPSPFWTMRSKYQKDLHTLHINEWLLEPGIIKCLICTVLCKYQGRSLVMNSKTNTKNHASNELPFLAYRSWGLSTGIKKIHHFVN